MWVGNVHPGSHVLSKLETLIVMRIIIYLYKFLRMQTKTRTNYNRRASGGVKCFFFVRWVRDWTGSQLGWAWKPSRRIGMRINFLETMLLHANCFLTEIQPPPRVKKLRKRQVSRCWTLTGPGPTNKCRQRCAPDSFPSRLPNPPSGNQRRAEVLVYFWMFDSMPWQPSRSP